MLPHESRRSRQSDSARGQHLPASQRCGSGGGLCHRQCQRQRRTELRRMRRVLRRYIARLRYLQDAAERHPYHEFGTIKMRFWTRLAVAAASVLLTTVQQAAAQEFSGNDLRDIRIGIAVADLPSAGYADFSCAADAKVKPSGWPDWRDCPAGGDGFR